MRVVAATVRYFSGDGGCRATGAGSAEQQALKTRAVAGFSTG
jgi:hypothetical protein